MFNFIWPSCNQDQTNPLRVHQTQEFQYHLNAPYTLQNYQKSIVNPSHQTMISCETLRMTLLIQFLGIVLKADTPNPNLLQSIHVMLFINLQIVDKPQKNISVDCEHAKVVVVIIVWCSVCLVSLLNKTNLQFFAKVVVFESMVHCAFKPLVPMILNLHWQAVKRFFYVEIHHLVV